MTRFISGLAVGLAALLLAAPAQAQPQDYPTKPALKAMMTGWYTFDQERLDGFFLRRVNLWVTGDVTSQLSYTAMLQPHKLIALPGIQTRLDNGQTTATAVAQGDRAILQDVFATYKPLDGLTLTVGQFRPPLSAEARNPAPRLPLANRALFLERNPFGFYRDLGLEASYKVHPSVKLTAGVFNGEGNNQPETNHQKDAIARIDFTPLPDLKLGAAYLRGTRGASADFKERLDLNAEYTLGATQLSGELLWGADAATRRLGWYGQAAHRFAERFQLVGRYEGWDADGADADLQQNGTLGLNYFLDENGTKVALNVIHETYWGTKARTNDAALLIYQVVL